MRPCHSALETETQTSVSRSRHRDRDLGVTVSRPTLSKNLSALESRDHNTVYNDIEAIDAYDDIEVICISSISFIDRLCSYTERWWLNSRERATPICTVVVSHCREIKRRRLSRRLSQFSVVDLSNFSLALEHSQRAEPTSG